MDYLTYSGFVFGFFVGGICIGAFAIAGIFLWSARNVSRLLKGTASAVIRTGLMVTTIAAIAMPIAVTTLFILMFKVPAQQQADFVAYALLSILVTSTIAVLGLRPSRSDALQAEHDER